MRNERIAKYIMIFLSFGICIVAIFNKYLPQMAKNVDDIEHIQETAATYINLVSGVILVVGIIIGFYTTRMHTEGVVLRDRYDAYVFDNPPNLSILRPISQTIINVYSHKTRKKDEAFRNAIYQQNEDPDPVVAQFNYINNEAHEDYRLYLSVQPFFLTLWVGFCVVIIILAISFNDSFVTTLINIMIPSLSAITTIGNSWYNCRLQMKQLQNLLTVIDQIQRLPDGKRLEYISDKRNMRALADGLFNYRVSPFVIPNFLIRRFLKKSVQTEGLQIPSDHSAPKTEMPTLTLLNVDSEVSDISDMITDKPTIRTITFYESMPIDVNTGVRKRFTRKSAAPQSKNATERLEKPAPKQEAKQAVKSGKQQIVSAKQEVKPSGKPDAKATVKQDAKPALKQDAKSAAKQEVKPAPKQNGPEAKHEVKNSKSAAKNK